MYQQREKEIIEVERFYLIVWTVAVECHLLRCIWFSLRFSLVELNKNM